MAKRKLSYRDLSALAKRLYRKASAKDKAAILREANAQRAAAQAPTNRRREALAQKARDLFRPKKSGRGKIHIVSSKGKESGTGYPIYVTKSGKKWVLRQQGKAPARARKVSDIELPFQHNLRKATKAFYKKRMKIIDKGTTLPIKRNEIKTKSWQTASGAIAESLKKRMDRQSGHRDFIIRVSATVRTREDGESHTIQFDAPLAKPANQSIPLEHMENYVDHVIYAYLARELAFLGYVTAGSANNIRNLPENEDADQEDWVDAMGNPWRGRDLAIVDIEEMDWQIVQLS